MTKQEINIQDGFLYQCVKSKQMVRIELVAGESLTGLLKRFDRFAVLLEVQEGEVLVYKHAIATIENRSAAD